MMMIKKILAGCTVVLFASLAHAQTAADLEAAFLQGCSESGNDQADCICIVQNWIEDLSEDELPFAMAAVEMSYQEKPPNPETLDRVLPMIMGLTDYLLRCAAGELTATGLTTPAGIPETGDATEAALLFERLASGAATIDEMLRYDQLIMDRRAAEKQAELEAQQATDARAAQARADLSETYQAELDRIHSRPISDWPVPAFEPLFGLYCQLGGNTQTACDCRWEQVTALAKSYALPYLASRSEGDDVLERLSAADLYGTLPVLSLLNERRTQCDGS